MLRQAKNLGTKLIVGVHSDEDVVKAKRPPVFNLSERVKMVKAIKWTDEVIEGAPYITTLETLEKNHCDFAVHGDDITTLNGSDTYNAVKDLNRYKEVPRTAGISTTSLINRILSYSAGLASAMHSFNVASKWTGTSEFLQTTRKIYEFSDKNSPPKSTDKIVYAPGTFDLFHVGHLDFLEKAKSVGDYLIVGLHGDVIVPGSESKPPIMNVHERTMNLLSCKYVNEVVIDAPLEVTKELIDYFNVTVVCHGGRLPMTDGSVNFDPYEVPKCLGKFKNIDSGSDVTTERVIERIKEHGDKYRTANKLKEENEVRLQIR